MTVRFCVQLIERAGRAAEEEKVEQKMAESWEELSLVSASPTTIRKGIEGVVMKHVAKATRQQKGMGFVGAPGCVKRENAQKHRMYIYNFYSQFFF